MSAFDDARVLVEHCRTEVGEVRSSYERSLHTRSIDSLLRIRIKNLMENLRSALDFVAQALFERHGVSSKAQPRIYFPYALESQDSAAFTASNRIETCVPGLSESRPDIADALANLQHCGSRPNSWLPLFMRLVNENKHERLTPQVRRTTRDLLISSGGASIRLGEGASIRLGEGAEISVGGAVIRGGQEFAPGRPPRVDGGSVDDITWVSFEFEGTGVDVYALLSAAVAGVANIVADLEHLSRAG